MSTPRRLITGHARTFGVIGWPVAHSLSPVIHGAAIDALGLDAVYVPLPVAPGSLAAAVHGLRVLGFAGANVTMPHKDETALLMDTLSEDAARLGAVNTIVIGEDGMVGHNTDAPGFDRMLRRDEGIDPVGRTALLFGAGGAARACALALARAGAARLIVAARDPGRVQALRAALDGLSAAIDVVAFADAAGHPADLIVNATPIGTRGETLPMPPVGSGVCFIDLLYEPPVTASMAAARAAGATVAGGLGLLLHQAALSFELWTGQVPPLDVMSAAALAAIADR